MKELENMYRYYKKNESLQQKKMNEIIRKLHLVGYVMNICIFHRKISKILSEKVICIGAAHSLCILSVEKSQSFLFD